MKKFFTTYFEYILLFLTLFFLFMKPNMQNFGERISMLFFGTLSFYYLASGILVFLDKMRVGRIMRLMYLFGLWSISITVIGVMCRTLLIQMDKELLTVSISSGIGLMFFIFLYYKKLAEDDKKTFQELIQPLFLRSVLAMFIAIAFLVSDNYGIYRLFGTHKHDKVYTEKLVKAYENPSDSLLVNDFKNYDAKIREQNKSDSTKTK